MSHTPGPWGWYISPLGMVIRTSDESEMIAKINGNNFPNARLISAAPDLLRLLKNAEFCSGTQDGESICPWCHCEGWEGKHDSDCEWVSVIAKIEGKEASDISDDGLD